MRALLLSLLLLSSSVRADDVSEAALAGRWKVVGTAPTAKNRDGLAELEKHGCYLYFEFAANGRAAVGIGSDSKAKLEALKKANPGVELDWQAKFEVANGRVEISGFPARLREPGGWLGDSATAIFRARLDGDQLELTGPGGFVAFQKVKQAGGATGTKANPKADANSVAGRWKFKKFPGSAIDLDNIYEKSKVYFYFEFAANGTVTSGAHGEDPKRPPPGRTTGGSAKYRVGPGGTLEIFDVDAGVPAPARLGLQEGKYEFARDGDALTLTEANGARTLEFVRAPKPTASALVGSWRMTQTTRWSKDQKELFDRIGTSTFMVYASNGTVQIEMRYRDGQLVPSPPLQPFAWKYRVVSDTELEYSDVPQYLRNETGPAGLKDRGTVTYKLTGDALVITEVDGKNTMTFEREKKK